MLDPYDIFGDEEVNVEEVKPPKYTMETAIDNLMKVEANITRNKKVEKKSFLQTYQRIQGLALLNYFQLVIDGKLKMQASADVAFSLYQKRGQWSYKARSIRGWADHYLKEGELKIFRQGLHVKTSSIITDEHVQVLFMSELREMKDEHRTPDTFQRLCNETLFKKIPNAPEKISLSTAARWLKFLGYNPKLQQKGYYTDCHNKQDVVEHREEVFLPTMSQYERRMQEYSGINMEISIPPDLLDEDYSSNTHDEIIDYS